MKRTKNGRDEVNIRKDVVEKFKRAIANSTYKIKSEEIAEKIAQKLKEEESRKIVQKIHSPFNIR